MACAWSFAERRWQSFYDFRLDLHEVTGPWASDAKRQAAPSVTTVIQEQLELRLEGRRQAIEIHAIDRIERSSEN